MIFCESEWFSSQISRLLHSKPTSHNKRWLKQKVPSPHQKVALRNNSLYQHVAAVCMCHTKRESKRRCRTTDTPTISKAALGSGCLWFSHQPHSPQRVYSYFWLVCWLILKSAAAAWLFWAFSPLCFPFSSLCNNTRELVLHNFTSTITHLMELSNSLKWISRFK